MFTGIVTDVGVVREMTGCGDRRVSITCAPEIAGADIGASICCSGVCLTVVASGNDWIAADVSVATFSVTNLGDWQTGTLVNLERSLCVGDELGGHIVTGHVDCLGKVVRFDSVGDSVCMSVAVPKEYAHLLAEKGSVAVNGVSLTLNQVEDREGDTVFTVNLIPHTQSVTSFKETAVGQKVNIEFDILARYVSRIKAVGI